MGASQGAVGAQRRRLTQPGSLAGEGGFPGGSGIFFFFDAGHFLKLINLFLAVLGLCCCTLAFSSCGERGLLFVAVHGFLIAVASLVAKHRL